MLFFILLLITYVIIISVVLFILISAFYSDFKGAPFVENQKNIILDSFDLINLNDNDKFLDLGCGNGLTLEIATLEYGVSNVCGVEISLWPYLLSNIRLRKSLKSINWKVFRENIIDTDLDGYTVIYLYLFPKLLEQIAPKLFDFLKSNPNARIVSPVFDIKWNKNHLDKILCVTQKSYNKRWKKEIIIYSYSFAKENV